MMVPREGIRANALAPGLFESEMTDQYKSGYLDTTRSRMLLRRVGDTAEPSATLVWLASEAGAFVTG
jgi:NAD(P)-dependent dehydrogenase (short-subunit alcohol dehydrogenase family)